jgi:hypothetical protein
MGEHSTGSERCLVKRRNTHHDKAVVMPQGSIRIEDFNVHPVSVSVRNEEIF